jgi:hypothetical protein
MTGKEIVHRWYVNRDNEALLGTKALTTLIDAIDAAIAQAVEAKDAEIARLTQLIAEAALAIPECSGTLRERILILKTYYSAEITKLTAKRDALRAEVDQHVGTIEVLDAELRRVKWMASRADGA